MNSDVGIPITYQDMKKLSDIQLLSQTQLTNESYSWDKGAVVLINHQGLKVLTGIQLQSPTPPIGLAYIGAYLKQHQINYTGVDACGADLERVEAYRGSKRIFIQGLSCEETIDRIPTDAKIIGFTCLFSHIWPLVVDLAELARKRFPSVILVIGGEHCTALAKESLTESSFDLAVMGEGEETFLELVTKVHKGEDWRNILGIAYINSDNKFTRNPPRKRITQIDTFPLPDWDNWHIEEYINNHQVAGINLGRTIPILGSRGCPYRCKFCSNEEMWTTRYIMRDPVKLVDEMEYFKNKYNVSDYGFVDLTFIVNRKKIKAFARELINRKIGVSYQLPSGTRCEAFDDELPALLNESGLKNFAFAPESGDPNILKIIRKRIDLDKFYSAVRSSLKTEMTICCFIVIGFPEDTIKSMSATLKMIRKLAWLGIHDVTVSKFTPYPGSDYFTELREKNLITAEFNDLEAVINFYSSEGKSYCLALTSRMLFIWMLYMNLNFYILSFIRRPYRVIKNLFDFFVHGVENTRYMRLFNELTFNRHKWRKRITNS